MLTWNLFHGRSVPAAGRELLAEFKAALAAWDWDLALLQEVPPWWPPLLGSDDHAIALTSRNFALALRRFAARRRPDLMRSGGGGANAILARGAVIEARAARRLRLAPERRVVHAVRIEGLWIANLHAHMRPPARSAADVALAARTVREWAGAAPAVLGGDFNLRAPRADGFVPAASHGVDHIFVRGLRPLDVELPDRGRLSDHAPLIATLGRD